MLLGIREYSTKLAPSAHDSIHNYYEKMVLEQTIRSNDRAAADGDFLADVACVALNRLPPRYVRYNVDMQFYLSPIEMEEMEDKVAKAVNEAVAYVESRDSLRSDSTQAELGDENDSNESRPDA